MIHAKYKIKEEKDSKHKNSYRRRKKSFKIELINVLYRNVSYVDHLVYNLSVKWQSNQLDGNFDLLNKLHVEIHF